MMGVLFVLNLCTTETHGKKTQEMSLGELAQEMNKRDDSLDSRHRQFYQMSALRQDPIGRRAHWRPARGTRRHAGRPGATPHPADSVSITDC